MNQKLETIFICSAPAPSGMEGRIMVRVEKAAHRRFLEKIAAGSITSIACAVALVFVSRELAAEAAASGFGQYFSLVFSNSGAMLSDWQDFAWTMVESAPVTGFALFLGASGLFIGTIRWTGRTFSGRSGTIGKLAI